MREIIGFWAAVLILAATVAANAQSVCAPCDFDGSGTVTLLDYSVFYQAQGSKMGDANFDHRVDYDSSGTITLLDWGFLLRFCPLSGSK